MSRFRKGSHVLGLMIGTALIASGCGTRVQGAGPLRSAPVGAALGPSSQAAQLADLDSQAGGSPTGEGASGGQPGTGQAGRTDQAGEAAPSGSATVASSRPLGGTGTRSTSGQPGTATVATRQAGPSAAGTGSGAGSTPGDAPAPLPPTPSGSSPVVIASVGTISGPAGAALSPMFSGAQIWVKWINARGGLNGHPVKLFTYDDAGDPARHRAQVQEAVEQRKVIAFLMNVELLSGNNSVDYLNSKRVPVVGMSGGEDWALSSPMYFPQAATGRALSQIFASSVGQQMVPKGKTKIGTLVCVEAQACPDIEKTFTDTAKDYGYQHVYKARVSLAQPDFTAECLAARNAGVEVLWINLDQNSARRVANSCSRQSYKPTYAIPGQGAAHSMKDDPNLDGLVAANPVFPYFQSGTPATDEYRQALVEFGQNVPPGGGPASGWTSGKLLEKAGRQLSEPPTTAALLAGLWNIKNDTLGGLTGPLTFTAERPPPPNPCWFNFAIANGNWVSPDNYTAHCR